MGVVGGFDLGEPLGEDGGEVGLHDTEGEAHAMAWLEEGNGGVGFEEVGVGVDLDEDVGAGRERVGGLDIAAAGTEIADLRAGAGVVQDVEDFGGCREGVALRAAAFVLEHGFAVRRRGESMVAPGAREVSAGKS